jgi:hypothetical protein
MRQRARADTYVTYVSARAPLALDHGRALRAGGGRVLKVPALGKLRLHTAGTEGTRPSLRTGAAPINSKALLYTVLPN